MKETKCAKRIESKRGWSWVLCGEPLLQTSHLPLCRAPASLASLSFVASNVGARSTESPLDLKARLVEPAKKDLSVQQRLLRERSKLFASSSRLRFPNARMHSPGQALMVLRSFANQLQMPRVEEGFNRVLIPTDEDAHQVHGSRLCIGT